MHAIDLPAARALVAGLPTAAALLRRPAVAAAWAAPSDLPGYTVGGIAGHLIRAVGRLETTLDAPTPVGGAEARLTDWYLDNRVATAEDLDRELPRMLRDDGEQLGTRGAESLAQELDALAVRLPERLATESPDRHVRVVLTDAPVPIADYVGSRVVELVVHADDVAVGAGVDPPAFEPAVLDAAAWFLLRLARVRSGDVAVLRAFTRAARVEDPADVLRVL